MKQAIKRICQWSVDETANWRGLGEKQAGVIDADKLKASEEDVRETRNAT